MKRRSLAIVLAAVLVIGLAWVILPKTLMQQFGSSGIEVKGWAASCDLGMCTYYYGSTLESETKIVEVLQRAGFKEDVKAPPSTGQKLFVRGDQSKSRDTARTVSLIRKKDYLQILTNRLFEER